MRYNNLSELITGSCSSRKYFLSLPIQMQSSLRKFGDCIHSAEGLRRTAQAVEKYSRSIMLSDSLDRYFR